jgi:hypothetical protein
MASDFSAAWKFSQRNSLKSMTITEELPSPFFIHYLLEVAKPEISNVQDIPKNFKYL